MAKWPILSIGSDLAINAREPIQHARWVLLGRLNTYVHCPMVTEFDHEPVDARASAVDATYR
jgi:hypothetical protein